MSIIQQIREKYAAVSIAVIALSLVGFILMDALSSRSSVFSGNKTTLGEINGTTVDITSFDARLTELENNYRQQGMEVNEEMRQQLIEMLWNNEVDETILKTQYEKLGLTFSPADLNEALYGDNPPPALAQQFKDEATGAYDANAARQFINSLRKKKASDPQRQYVEKNLIEYLISSGLRNKYNALLTGSIFYPKWLSEREQADQDGFASLSYVFIPYTSINDSTVQVSDADINAYVAKRKTEFKQEASRTLTYVVFDAAPTTADTAETINEVIALKEGFRETTNPEQFLNANASAQPFFDGFVVKSKMQVPNADSIQALPAGGIFGPYLDGSNVVLARMVDKRQLADSIKCRHILISTRDAQSGQEIMSDSAAKSLADSLAAAIAKGSDFKTLAARFSTDPGSKDNGGEYEFSSQQFGNLARPFAEFVFYKPKGSKEVIKTDFGYHYIEVMEQKNFEPAFKIAYLARTIDASNETINIASTAATQFASMSRDAKTFEQNTRDRNLAPRVAEVKPNEYNIIGIGNARRLIRWAFENKQGAVSEPESYADKFVVALITEVKEEGVMNAKSARLQVEQQVRNQKKAAQIISKIGNSRDLTAVANSFGTTVSRADSIQFTSPFIPGIGTEARVSGAAFFAANKGKVSDPIPGNNGVYLIRTEELGMRPSSGLDYTFRRMQMEQSQKGSFSYKASDGLRKSATIKDKRVDFY
ncbi:MAG TPA: SurA N-terminal domain-containing protein [Lacibacter sp.]|nr:SurA N-terminal domain-containing protein [Lacibacter sp.]HMO90111.1 SurA N-terminal domain-containing protein [Lacibacter sp.]HMP85732.1 SurA N-terminal domain-containing protein [Lacibacter sp.]